MKEYSETVSKDQLSLEREVDHLLRALHVEEREGLPMAYEEFVRWDDEEQKPVPRQGVVLRLHYVSLTNGGVKVEGEPYPWADDTAVDAINSYVAIFRRYLGGCKHVVWRHRPQLECSTKRTDTWTVYSRLAIYT